MKIIYFSENRKVCYPLILPGMVSVGCFPTYLRDLDSESMTDNKHFLGGITTEYRTRNTFDLVITTQNPDRLMIQYFTS